MESDFQIDIAEVRWCALMLRGASLSSPRGGHAGYSYLQPPPTHRRRVRPQPGSEAGLGPRNAAGVIVEARHAMIVDPVIGYVLMREAVGRDQIIEALNAHVGEDDNLEWDEDATDGDTVGCSINGLSVAISSTGVPLPTARRRGYSTRCSVATTPKPSNNTVTSSSWRACPLCRRVMAKTKLRLATWMLLSARCRPCVHCCFFRKPLATTPETWAPPTAKRPI